VRERSLARTGLRVPHPGSVAATTSVPATFQRRLHPGMLRPPGRFRLAFLLLVRAVLSLSLHAGSDPDSIRAVYSRSLLSTVNENDARAALKAYSRTLAMEISLTNRITADLVDGVDALEGLRGKPLLRQEIAAGDITRAWLRLLLLDRRLGTSEDFFSKVTSTSRPTSAILPVFFGNAAACIADEHSFALMSELNPAVGKQLQIIAASDVFADVVVCLSKSGWIAPTDRAATELSLRELHADPAGQQICTLFKFERMVPFDPAHLESVRRLRSDCRRRSKEGSP